MQEISAIKLLDGLISESEKQRFENIIIDNVVTDSRQANSGSVFVAINGENVDGHDFIDKALQNGAQIVLAQHNKTSSSDKLVIVQDPLDAMIKMGENYKKQFDLILTAVTGSVGKTTTKEFCYVALKEFGETIKTQGNQNNEIGMPNTLFRLQPSTKFAVVEMGMQGLGEIRKLTLAAKPNAAIITSVGTSHLEHLKTRENICKAKLEICEGIQDGGFVVINLDDDYLPFAKIPKNIDSYSFSIQNEKADVMAKNINQTQSEQSFVICDKKYGEYNCVIPCIGKHNVYNALAAYTLATRLGLDAKKVSRQLSNYKTTGYRQNIVMVNGVTVIEDCYNANPDSMQAALNTLSQIENVKNKIAVIGDMLELGEISNNAHYDIGKLCAKLKLDAVICVGEQAKYMMAGAKENSLENVYHFTDKTKAAEKLYQLTGKDSCVLFKASRGLKFEDIMQQYYLLLNGKEKKNG